MPGLHGVAGRDAKSTTMVWPTDVRGEKEKERGRDKGRKRGGERRETGGGVSRPGLHSGDIKTAGLRLADDRLQGKEGGRVRGKSIPRGGE